MKQTMFYFDPSNQAIAELFSNKAVEKKTGLSCVEQDCEETLLDSFRSYYKAKQSLGLKPKGFQTGAVFFDMDSTVIGQETIVELAAACDRRSEVEGITERAMAGELDFKQALKERVDVLAGLPVSIISLTQQRLIPEPGIQSFVAKASAQGIPCYLISGGFIELAKPLAEQLGFAGCHANGLEVVDGCLTGKLAGPIVDAEAKANYLLDICSKLNIEPANAVAVGDGANDIEMMKAAGLSVGYKPKPVLYPLVDALNHTGSHEFLEGLLLS